MVFTDNKATAFVSNIPFCISWFRNVLWRLWNVVEGYFGETDQLNTNKHSHGLIHNWSYYDIIQWCNNGKYNYLEPLRSEYTPFIHAEISQNYGWYSMDRNVRTWGSPKGQECMDMPIFSKIMLPTRSLNYTRSIGGHFSTDVMWNDTRISVSTCVKIWKIQLPNPNKNRDINHIPRDISKHNKLESCKLTINSMSAKNA